MKTDHTLPSLTNMKSDRTPPSTSTINAKSEEKLLSNQQLPPAKPQKSLIEDETEISESTAHGSTAAEHQVDNITTPKQRHQSKVAAAAKTPKVIHVSKPKPTPTAAQNRQIIKTPVAFFNDSTLSPTLTEAEQQRQARPNLLQISAEASNQKFINLTKFKDNIAEIQEDQAKEFSWIRKLATQKWIDFVDAVLTGLTMLFFTVAFYLIFHINPTLEVKLTPEFRLKVQPFTVKESFQNCNHSNWIRHDDSLAPDINASLCFGKFEYGRIIYETYNSSTPNFSDICNIDRIEIQPCYTELPEAKNDPMKIFWGVNDTEFYYTCNGSLRFDGDWTTLYSFNPPVQKHAMLDSITMPHFLDRIVSSTAFFFQCPKCSVMYRTITDDPRKRKKFVYYVAEIVPSIPFGFSRECQGVVSTGHYNSKNKKKCRIDGSRFIRDIQKSFSREVFSFVIVEDKEFCS